MFLRKNYIYVIPFVTDYLQQRIKYVREAVNDFVVARMSDFVLIFMRVMLHKVLFSVYEKKTGFDISLAFQISISPEKFAIFSRLSIWNSGYGLFRRFHC